MPSILLIEVAQWNACNQIVTVVAINQQHPYW